MVYVEPKPIVREDIITAFKKEDLEITKISSSKLGGFYIYHPHGYRDMYWKYSIIEKCKGYVRKLKEPIIVNRDFADNEDMLDMIIAEAKNRRGN